MSFSTGKHNELQKAIIEEFGAWFAPGAECLYFIESVTSVGPMDNKRIVELQELTKNVKSGKIFVTAFLDFLKSATYRISWEFTCKTTKILLLYIFLGHNRNVVNTKFPYPIKRLEVIRGLTRKAWPLTKVCLEQVGISIVV